MMQPVLGEYADYINTGLWRLIGNEVVAPEDITLDQIKDFLLAYGGAVFLREDGKIGWINVKRGPA